MFLQNIFVLFLREKIELSSDFQILGKKVNFILGYSTFLRSVI